MSTKLSYLKTEVVPVELIPHKNADTLSIVRVKNYVVVVRTEDWLGVTKGAYVTPDSEVDVTKPWFAFLDKGEGKPYRVTCKKLRGVMSFGFLVPAPEGSEIGDNVADILGVTHWNPPEVFNTSGETAAAPFRVEKYDIDNLQNYDNAFVDGEDVIVTEKIHGSNARYVFHDGEMHCGSRTQWLKNTSSNVWWRVLQLYPQIEEFCRANPDKVLYGEIYGGYAKAGFGYGKDRTNLGFVAFDVFDPATGTYVDALAARDLASEIPWVPLFGIYKYSFESMEKLASGKTTMPNADHIREGIVVKPVKERWNDELGRVILKLVSPEYLEKS